MFDGVSLMMLAGADEVAIDGTAAAGTEESESTWHTKPSERTAEIDAKRILRSMGMSLTECKKECEGNGFCKGVLLDLDEEAYGTCWMCTFDIKDCGEF